MRWYWLDFLSTIEYTMTNKSLSKGSCTGSICLIWVGCAVLGSYGAATYAKTRNNNALYTETICSLLNYTSVTRNCKSCTSGPGGRRCTTYTCYDESFTVSYMILNGTTVNATFSVQGSKKPHKESEVWVGDIGSIWISTRTRRILEEHHYWLWFLFYTDRR